MKQLWTMTPVGAAWTESMELGGQLHGQAIDEFYQELYDSNVKLNGELGATRLHLQFARETAEQVRTTNRALLLSLHEAHVELELLRKERDAQAELDRLAVDIWGPVKRSKPDGSWDPPPVLLCSTPSPSSLAVKTGSNHPLYSTTPSPSSLAVVNSKTGRDHPLYSTTPSSSYLAVVNSKTANNPGRNHSHSSNVCLNPSDPPITVGRIAAELGFKSDAMNVHRLGGHVREAFMRAHGKAPEPLVYYNEGGVATRIGCFTERDRELISCVVREHGERSS